jgi:ethanolamine ammonia-lyase small subunit
MLARRSTGRMVQVQRKRQEAANAVRADHARRRQTRMSTVANADLKKVCLLIVSSACYVH